MHATTKSAPAQSSAVTLAVDLAKDVFELAFADADGRVVERKRLKRAPFAACLSNRPLLCVVIEGNGGGKAGRRCGVAHCGRGRAGHAFQHRVPGRAMLRRHCGNEPRRNRYARGMRPADGRACFHQQGDFVP